MEHQYLDVFRLYCKNAIKISPEFVELLDQHPDYDQHRINVIIGYKWIISAIVNFFAFLFFFCFCFYFIILCPFG